MNRIAKVLVPVTLALSAFAAQAAGPQGAFADYPGNVNAYTTGAAAGAAAGFTVGGPALRGDEQPTVGTPAASSRSREDVQREAAQPRRVDPSYIA